MIYSPYRWRCHPRHSRGANQSQRHHHHYLHHPRECWPVPAHAGHTWIFGHSVCVLLPILISHDAQSPTSSCQSVSQTPDIHKLTRVLHVMGILSTVALILTIVGGTDLGNAKNQNDVNSAVSKRHIGVILFLVLFILITLIHGFLWTRENELMRHRRTVSHLLTLPPPCASLTDITSCASFSKASPPHCRSSPFVRCTAFYLASLPSRYPAFPQMIILCRSSAPPVAHGRSTSSWPSLSSLSSWPSTSSLVPRSRSTRISLRRAPR